MTDSYTYDAWGNVTGHTGESAQPYQFVGQLGYYTHVQDSNLPLLQLGVRFYDPEVGRFTQVDPVPGESERYDYGANAPTRRVDPHGLAAADPGPDDPDYDPITECEKRYKQCIEPLRLERAACELDCAVAAGIIGGATLGAAAAGALCKAGEASLISGLVAGIGIVVVGTVDYAAYRICMRTCKETYEAQADTCRMARAICRCRARHIPLRRCREFAPWRPK